MKKIIVVLLFCLISSLSFAATPADIEVLEKQLIQKETELLEPELNLDKYLVDRAKLDGVGGWFQGKKKKELEKRIATCESEISRIYGDMKGLQNQIQKVVFEVAETLEKKGDYKQAIEYYLKVENQTNTVIYRIGYCYKRLKEYENAIQWFLRMTRTDQNLLEVVDCYKLDKRIKEAISWLFKILEPIDGNPAEEIALKLIEEYDYSGKKHDYPDFNERLSDIYISRAVRFYQKDFNQAKSDYRKAASLLNKNSPESASLNIVSKYQDQYRIAMDILSRQREAAERHYESLLRDAKEEYDQRKRRYYHAEREAEMEYSRQLDTVKESLRRAQGELEALQKQASPSAQLIANAKQKLEETRRNYQYVQSHRSNIIEDYLRPYRRDMDHALREYENIMDRRREIIEEYIAPYKRKVAEAQHAFEMIRNLHEAAFL